MLLINELNNICRENLSIFHHWDRDVLFRYFQRFVKYIEK